MNYHRTIIHVDMDAFFAAVEQQRHPEYEGRPLIVGGNPNKRGVVSTGSYEARQYGIKSGMPSILAHRRCPEAIFLPVDMTKYQEVSEQLMGILERYTNRMEPVGLDEAFLDVTDSINEGKSPDEIAIGIKHKIKEELGLTASIGVGPNKLIAKLASGLNKPDGFTIIKLEDAEKALENLPASRLWGIGRKTEQKLRDLGIETIGQLRATSRELLQLNFGQTLGSYLHQIAHGIDDSPVAPPGEPKSLSYEVTFEKDVVEVSILESVLSAMADNLLKQLRAARFQFRTVTLKVRFSDFTTITRGHSFQYPTDSQEAILAAVSFLLEKAIPSGAKIRLVGLQVANLMRWKVRQLSLFAPERAQA